MAVLSKIRQRSLLLILVIGFCLLAFIVGDIINSGGFGVTRNIGSVNGEDIPAQDFLQRVGNITQNQPGTSATAASNMLWNSEVERILFVEQYEKAGIRVGRDHVVGAYSQDSRIAGNPQFQNALGQFDKNKFNEYLVNIKNTNPEMWRGIEQSTPFYEENAKKQIYITMLKAGMIATEAEGKAKYHEENDKATFDYVYVPYSTVNDDEVKVSDDEIISFMKKNEKKYKSEASRALEVITIENKPSAADEAEMKNRINSLLVAKVEYNNETKANDTVPGFREATDVEKFVNDNSDVRYDTTYVTKAQLPLDHAEQIFNLAKGAVYGPYIDNGYYKLTKMMNKRQGKNANVTHVLVAYKGAMNASPAITRTKEEAKALANSYLAQVNANPASIGQIARANSDDPGAASNGGVYDVSPDAPMVQEFKDFALNNAAGKTGVVETDFGFHVMRVNSREEVQLATIAQVIAPSDETTDAAFTKASKFEMDAADKDFAELAKEQNLNIVPVNKILANDENVPGIGNHREIVRWAFSKDTEVGDVKKFDVPQGHVVVRLKDKNDNGLLSLEEAKQTVLPILRDQKKAEIIKKNKMTGNTLEAVSQKTGSAIATASDVTFAAPLIPNVGPEPKVVGTAFGLAEGKTSGLIEGKMGVFMIKAKGVTKAAELPNYNSITTRLKSEARGSAAGRITAALKAKADIKDKRADFN